MAGRKSELKQAMAPLRNGVLGLRSRDGGQPGSLAVLDDACGQHGSRGQYRDQDSPRLHRDPVSCSYLRHGGDQGAGTRPPHHQPPAPHSTPVQPPLAPTHHRIIHLPRKVLFRMGDLPTTTTEASKAHLARQLYSKTGLRGSETLITWLGLAFEADGA